MRKALVLTLALLAAGARAQESCPAGRTPIAILGTYHFAGSTADAVNQEVDDVLSPRRQKEVEDVVAKLARFKPTKVMIESGHWLTTWTDRYKGWREGKYTLGHNEIEQLGFRLAASQNHARLWPVDYPMWMNGITPAEQHRPKAKANATPAAAPAMSPEEEELMKSVQAQVAKDDERLRTSTIAEYLAYQNTPERYRLNHQWDVMSNLAPGDGPALYENTDRATNWYKRNLRIVTNIMKVTEPGDRLLFIVGAGHQKILKDLFAEHPRYCLVDTVPLLR
ncbi:MAG TPA: DUF5694 domain-containing protein [Thermoanaerobaculia bacterium]|nr:DUF5694 domain-containing protein [Thermoanaerobaculia bacterium]